jgi:peptidoglycan-N-acetylglucosamine deacetylase
MRAVGIVLAVGLLAAASPLRAEEPCTSPGALGVHRTIAVDTTGGPWFGAPHGDARLLEAGEVVLTFDDGPSPTTTRPILEALAAQCTKATFFMVGRMAVEHADVVREVAAQGHTIGTHTWSHSNLQRQSVDGMKLQIETAFTAVEKAAGGPIAPFFRYPFLNDTPEAIAYLRTRNIGQFAIDIDTLDWLSRNAQSVIRKAMAGLERRGKGIVLLHDIHPSTAAAVPLLLVQLKAKGYKMVHLRGKSVAQTLAAYTAPAKDARTPIAQRQFAVRSKNTAPSAWKWPW